MYPLRYNRQRARWAVMLFYPVIGISILQALFFGWEYYYFSTSGGGYDADTYFIVVKLEQILMYVAISLYYLTAVFFIMWFRRAYNNLYAANPAYASFSEGWAAGAWFIPIMNLVRPFQMMREIWTGTQAAVPHRFPEGRSHLLVSYWWTAHISMIIMGYIIRGITRYGNGASLLTLSVSAILQELMTIAAAVLAMMMIKRISVFETALWEEAQHPSDSVFAISAAEVPPAPPAS